MLTLAPDLKLFRQFNQQFYRLFERDISKACAHARRTRLVNHAPYQANALLAKALKKLSNDKFNHMIVFLGWEDGERTNNHVEPRFKGSDRSRRFFGLKALHTTRSREPAHDT